MDGDCSKSDFAMDGDSSKSASAVNFSAPALSGATYIPPAKVDFEGFDAQLLCAQLAQYVQQNGTQRLAISGFKGPMVRATLQDRSTATPLPAFLEAVWNACKQPDEKLFQVSCNHYFDPTLKMVPHKDGRGHKGYIASFGGYATLNFCYRPEEYEFGPVYTRVYEEPSAEERASGCVHSFLLEPGSILVVEGAAFRQWVHFIDSATTDVVHDKLANFHQLSQATKDMREIQRAPRVSVVMWPDGEWRTKKKRQDGSGSVTDDKQSDEQARD